MTCDMCLDLYPEAASYINLVGCIHCSIIREEYLCTQHWYRTGGKEYICHHCMRTDTEYYCEPL